MKIDQLPCHQQEQQQQQQQTETQSESVPNGCWTIQLLTHVAEAAVAVAVAAAAAAIGRKTNDNSILHSLFTLTFLVVHITAFQAI